jgi:hypothetical protein
MSSDRKFAENKKVIGIKKHAHFERVLFRFMELPYLHKSILKLIPCEGMNRGTEQTPGCAGIGLYQGIETDPGLCS